MSTDFCLGLHLYITVSTNRFAKLLFFRQVLEQDLGFMAVLIRCPVFLQVLHFLDIVNAG